MSIPKVFISYSHDSMEHKKWVLELAMRMRNNGIDAILDQWKLNPGDDLPHFMETNLASSDYTIMVCSTKYVEKANSGKGGVGYEKTIYDWIEFQDLYHRITMSKIYMEILLKQAVELEYIVMNNSKDILLTDKGKSYALENNLV